MCVATAAVVRAHYSFSAEQSWEGSTTAFGRSRRAPPLLQPWRRHSEAGAAARAEAVVARSGPARLDLGELDSHWQNDRGQGRASALAESARPDLLAAGVSASLPAEASLALIPIVWPQASPATGAGVRCRRGLLRLGMERAELPSATTLFEVFYRSISRTDWSFTA